MPPRKKQSLDNKTLGDVIDSALSEDPIVPGEPAMWISTGSDLLDWAIGQGIPCGRMIEMFGKESSGKSMLALHAARNVLRNGGNVVYLDCEAGMDLPWMKRMGVDPTSSQVIIRTPNYLEEVQDAIERVAEKVKDHETPTLIVWDSLAAVASKASYDKKSAEETVAMGLEARLMSDYYRRRVLKVLRNTRCALVVINQIRATLARTYTQEAETTPGGWATKFYACVRLKVKRTGYVRTENDPPQGIYMNCEVVKNKVGPPARVVDLVAFFRYGLDNNLSLIRFLEDQEAIEKTANGRVIWNGKTMLRNDLRHAMNTDVKVLEEVREMAREAFKKAYDI